MTDDNAKVRAVLSTLMDVTKGEREGVRILFACVFGIASTSQEGSTAVARETSSFVALLLHYNAACDFDTSLKDLVADIRDKRDSVSAPEMTLQ